MLKTILFILIAKILHFNERYIFPGAFLIPGNKFMFFEQFDTFASKISYRSSQFNNILKTICLFFLDMTVIIHNKCTQR